MLLSFQLENFLENESNKWRLIKMLIEELEREGFAVKLAEEDAVITNVMEAIQLHQ